MFHLISDKLKYWTIFVQMFDKQFQFTILQILDKYSEI